VQLNRNKNRMEGVEHSRETQTDNVRIVNSFGHDIDIYSSFSDLPYYDIFLLLELSNIAACFSLCKLLLNKPSRQWLKTPYSIFCRAVTLNWTGKYFCWPSIVDSI
jgi:hypothetical protein